MTLLVDKTDLPPEQARAHVFVVGVGDYSRVPEQYGLLDLPSACPSADAITKWFQEEYTYVACPLGSLELLLSPVKKNRVQKGIDSSADPRLHSRRSEAVKQNRVQKGIDRASYPNIASAFKRWVKRCDGPRGDRSFFYFCGHGVESEDLFLLPDDVGEGDGDMWLRSLNMTRTLGFMRQHSIPQQFYFLDCCRFRPFWLDDPHCGHIDRAAILAPNLQGPQRVRTLCALTATDAEAGAQGTGGGLSVFCQFLLDSFRGGAAKDQESRWALSSDLLQYAVREVGRFHNLDLPPEDRYPLPRTYAAYGPEVFLHEFNDHAPPTILTRFDCHPDEAGQTVTFHLTPHEGQASIEVSQPIGRYYRRHSLPVGMYTMRPVCDLLRWGYNEEAMMILPVVVRRTVKAETLP